MSYGRSRLTAHYQAGDPFLGSIIKGVGKFVGGAVTGLVTTGTPVGAVVGGIRGALGKPQIQAMAPSYTRVATPPVSAMPGGAYTAGGGPMGAIYAAGAAAQRAPRMTKAGYMTTRKRPRMNPMNPKAARRAARRLDSYVREYKRVEKTLRKLAPPRRRSGRADLGPGHRHVR